MWTRLLAAIGAILLLLSVILGSLPNTHNAAKFVAGLAVLSLVPALVAWQMDRARH